ncbi:hypothetical protein VTN00DRAFT_8715 [Thermoascus crustaceus]|uniref:uncharacterized protein n=1 Tax=Thermoascus crustaceus TaxID=5088 RepID=UPI003743BE84
MGRHPVQQPSGSSTDRFGQPSLPSTRGEASVPLPGRSSRLSAYAGYGYTDQHSYSGSSLHGGSLQGGGLQYQADFSQAPLRQQQTPHQHHQQGDQSRQPQAPQPSQQQFSQYGANMLYGINQQGQAPAQYEVVPPYPPRQSAALEVLSTQFGVPQYFAPGEPAGAGVTAVVSQYLTPQVQPSYSQQSPVGRSNAVQSFPVTMADYNPIGTSEGLEQHEQVQESTNVDDAYDQYQQALRVTFDHTRAGRLIDASRTLLEISEWLVGNARELGILRDDQERHSDRLKLWNDFNICWLAVCQKQKDMTHDLLETGEHQPNVSMLTTEMMDKMGKELIRLCDKMEQHGLVDYQMGIWEEEILCVLGHCIDLLEEGGETDHAHDSTRDTAVAARP